MTFNWPWQYNFPPFFTIQPHAETKRVQLDAWKKLILSYTKEHKWWTLDVIDVQATDLFTNKAINRHLNIDSIYIVLEDLKNQGSLEWIDKNRKRCYIYWRTPEEWGEQIYSWAKANGMLQTVCTFYELTEGEDTIAEDFYGMDNGLLIKALRTLEVQNKAEIIMDDATPGGVKFF